MKAPRVVLSIFAATVLALCGAPAYAQRGGGGHAGGGGGHFGGGGFGGARGGSFGGGHFGGGGRVAPAPRVSMPSSRPAGNVNSRFVPPPAVTPRSSVGGNAVVNNRFVAPPVNSSRTSPLLRRPNLILGGPVGGYPIRNHFPVNCRLNCGVFVGSTPFYPGYGFAPSYGLLGFGWGFGGFSPWGLYNPWLWGFDSGLGYYDWNNPAPPPDSDYDQTPQDYDQTPQNNSAIENTPGLGNAIYEALEPPAAAPEENVPSVNPVLVLKDGTTYAVTDYWMMGGQLHYITSYGGDNNIDVNQLDLQKTVDENAKRGINFTLRPTPLPQ